VDVRIAAVKNNNRLLNGSQFNFVLSTLLESDVPTDETTQYVMRLPLNIWKVDIYHNNNLI
jgi:hypothetical protein